jgi:ABC-type amino acid transport substrate-binding protein
MAFTRRAALALAAWPAVAGASAPRKLIYPRFNKDINPDELNPVQLLTAALQAAGYDASLEITPGEMPQARALQELQQKTGRIQVMWTMTSKEREERALPVRVPIERGLFGWRLLVAKEERLEELSAITNLTDLRRYKLLQGLHWPDSEILRHNGLEVVSSNSFAAMYQQLRAGRADAFPRSVEEVWWELTQYGEGLCIVPGVVLHYPTALYYFVQPGDTELAQAIELGLSRLRASGVFERMFQKFHEPTLARGKLAQRRVIELVNPLLSPETPLGQRELWFHP